MYFSVHYVACPEKNLNKCHSLKPVTVRIIQNRTVCPNKMQINIDGWLLLGFKMIEGEYKNREGILEL